MFGDIFKLCNLEPFLLLLLLLLFLLLRQEMAKKTPSVILRKYNCVSRPNLVPIVVEALFCAPRTCFARSKLGRRHILIHHQAGRSCKDTTFPNGLHFWWNLWYFSFFPSGHCEKFLTAMLMMTIMIVIVLLNIIKCYGHSCVLYNDDDGDLEHNKVLWPFLCTLLSNAAAESLLHGFVKSLLLTSTSSQIRKVNFFLISSQSSKLKYDNLPTGEKCCLWWY